MLFAPKKVVLNWFRHDVSYSMELIESYIQSVEKQAAESIDRYKIRKKELFEDESASVDQPTVVEVYQGLDDVTWALEDVFCQHFPSLQRRSALLTVWAYFEYELNQLCLLYQSEKSFKLAPSDLKDKGVDRSTNYLEKVAGIDTCKTSKEWNHIKKIQIIRNLIVHNDGKIIDRHGKQIKVAIDYINEMEFLSEDSEVIVEEGFLAHVVSTFKEYCRMLAKSIENKEGA